jgi:hypothetical protein
MGDRGRGLVQYGAENPEKSPWRKNRNTEGFKVE